MDCSEGEMYTNVCFFFDSVDTGKSKWKQLFEFGFGNVISFVLTNSYYVYKNNFWKFGIGERSLVY